MSKRKKVRPSGVRPPKPPKAPKLEDINQIPPSSQASQLPLSHHPEEADGPAGPAARCSTADLVLGASSPAEEAASSAISLQLPGEPEAMPPSQNPTGRFVPQFARPRKMAPRQVGSEEMLRTQAVGSEAQVEPPPAEGACPQHSNPGKEDPPPVAPPGIAREQGSTSCASESPPDSTEPGPDSGVPPGGATQRGANTDLPDQDTDPEPPSTTADLPEHSPGVPGGGARQSSQSAPCTPSEPLITDVSTGLEGAGQDRQPDLGALGGHHSGALPLTEGRMPPGKMGAGKGEPAWEDDAPFSILGGGAGLPSPPAAEAHLEGAHVQLPSHELGDGDPSTLLPQTGELCPGQSSGCQTNTPAPQEVESGPSGIPAGQPEQSPDTTEEADWGSPAGLELNFLPDSLIQDVLDAPSPLAPPEQPTSWGSLSPGQHVKEDHHVPALPRPQEAATVPLASVEDATKTVRGLVLELSNLNRLVMSAHRDLEACRRLCSRPGKPATTRGLSWWDL